MIFDNDMNCCGCSACASICPADAIRMELNDEGFSFPCIDESSCIRCNKCDDVCMIGKERYFEQTKQLYVASNRSDEQLKISSSGGIFLALALYVLNRGGYVAGCLLDEDLKARHAVTNDIKVIYQMCGSKYVQSEINTCYVDVKKLLDNNHIVLFTGTPCQVEGLKLFLNKDYASLITVDIICHGVPSPLLWKKHIEWIEKKSGEKILYYRFRTKEKAEWSLYYYYYYTDNSIGQGISRLDPYYTDFLNGNNFRECCYNCKFTSLKRCADLTIGDYWGGELIHKSFDKRKGLSLFLLNSEKGREMFNKISMYIRYEPTDKLYALSKNARLVKPTDRPAIRDNYYKSVLSDIPRWEKSFRRTKGWKITKLKSMLLIITGNKFKHTIV